MFFFLRTFFHSNLDQPLDDFLPQVSINDLKGSEFILTKIFSMMSLGEQFKALPLVCKKWRQIILDPKKNHIISIFSKKIRHDQSCYYSNTVDPVECSSVHFMHFPQGSTYTNRQIEMVCNLLGKSDFITTLKKLHANRRNLYRLERRYTSHDLHIFRLFKSEISVNTSLQTLKWSISQANLECTSSDAYNGEIYMKFFLKIDLAAADSFIVPSQNSYE